VLQQDTWSYPAGAPELTPGFILLEHLSYPLVLSCWST
jgi:hypothetical protein